MSMDAARVKKDAKLKPPIPITGASKIEKMILLIADDAVARVLRNSSPSAKTIPESSRTNKKTPVTIVPRTPTQNVRSASFLSNAPTSFE